MFGLTTPQKSVLLTEQYYRNTNINNVSGYLHISEKDVDTSKLELGINNFIKDNQQVRARIFQDEDYQLKQYYKKYRKEKIQVVKLQDLKAKEEYEKSFCTRRFNLIEKKLYRSCIY
jgi:DNA polymerase sigma